MIIIKFKHFVPFKSGAFCFTFSWKIEAGRILSQDGAFIFAPEEIRIASWNDVYYI